MDGAFQVRTQYICSKHVKLWDIIIFFAELVYKGGGAERLARPAKL